MKKQVALIILDGWGHSVDFENNAIAKSKTEFFDNLWNNYPHSLLHAGEEHVGLPRGQVGNSEIGHMTIGAGQVIDTDLVKISKSIKNGDFENNSEFKKIFDSVKEKNSTLHIMGLLGEGGVHSHQEHLNALIDLCKKNNLQKVALHLFTDGRDSGPQDSIKILFELFKKINSNIFISTISGRYYSMDRDNNWDRLDNFLNLLKESQNKNLKLSFEEIISEIKKQHEIVKSDEHIKPFVVQNCSLSENDAVIIFNFRADRVRMLTSKLLEEQKQKNIKILTFTEYSQDFDVQVAFPAKEIETVLAKEISQAGLSQVHIAETEKFPHATYFLNGGVEKPFEKEEHILIPSRKDVATHDLAPEMKAREIADEAIKKINQGVDFIFINFANPDMVGHTANVSAIIKAVEVVDGELKRVIDALSKKNGVAIITADHGNAELNIDPITKELHTSHTLNQVPCILTSNDFKIKNGSLIDLAPTVLDLFEIKKPNCMTGNSLLI
ncbi:MAG TPA: 2,3-bisphosphoglycerate-independent phosphoglycerate mutase [Candidatus Paceibacterota bacterium]|nr:2,3-bisphosphoglycerate-independent phosphoglycerate mutase [Candidatus Paceibacterota bacterium]HMP18819.1 2,3-bisphosphoglycerate-independent phosphoglycerate mutase [Candidatus Paceibacterota bacterium]HMP85540.1 2,3-bisphosphoglycerate-independent phosphoglycerate mutase [Candidatus Paceibacterota bacterium]